MIEHQGRDRGEAAQVDPNAFGEDVFAFALAMKRQMAARSKDKKNTWQKLNPLNLLHKLTSALRDAQLSNEVVGWADVANYCMMMYTMESGKRLAVTRGPKMVCFTVPSEVAATYVKLIKSQGLALNVSKLNGDSKKLEVMSQQVHQFFGQLHDAMLPIADQYEAEQLAAAAEGPETNLTKKGNDPTQKPDKE